VRRVKALGQNIFYDDGYNDNPLYWGYDVV